MISFYSKTDRRTVLDKAGFLLQFLANRSPSDPPPDRGLFLKVAHGWLRADDADNAERVVVWWLQVFMRNEKDRGSQNLVKATEFIEELKQMSERNNRSAGPKPTTYETLYRAWDVSIRPDKDQAMKKLEAKIAHLRYAKQRSI
jgi:hypothetical protein